MTNQRPTTLTVVDRTSFGFLKGCSQFLKSKFPKNLKEHFGTAHLTFRTQILGPECLQHSRGMFWNLCHHTKIRENFEELLLLENLLSFLIEKVESFAWRLWKKHKKPDSDHFSTIMTHFTTKTKTVCPLSFLRLKVYKHGKKNLGHESGKEIEILCFEKAFLHLIFARVLLLSR